MRRLIALVLLLLLPLQSIWAAAEPYCKHEAVKGSIHVGHHVHEHHADADDHDADAKKASPSSMADHDNHCCGSLSMLPSATQVPGTVPQTELIAAPLAAYGHVVVPRIERPNWPASL